jgi:Arc/MetJ family transcription regulator
MLSASMERQSLTAEAQRRRETSVVFFFARFFSAPLRLGGGFWEALVHAIADLTSASMSASFDVIIGAHSVEIPTMRTTVTLDEALLDKAQLLSGVQERSALLKEALGALIQRESARRLARLGGTEPQLELVARRREGKR